jgi:hypothetical protein
MYKRAIPDRKIAEFVKARRQKMAENIPDFGDLGAFSAKFPEFCGFSLLLNSTHQFGGCLSVPFSFERPPQKTN